MRRDAKARIEYKKNGDWVAHVPPENAKRAFQMMEGSRRAKRDRGAELDSRQVKHKVVNKHGKVVELSEDAVDRYAKKGIKPVGRGGRSAALYFDMASAAERYVRGPDGLDFVWQDGWEPAPLFTPRAESPQRDPDGNVWVKQGTEWVLDNEVE